MNHPASPLHSAELARWLATPAGGVVRAWESARLEEAVADVFGFHALQLGLPEIDGLRANRMPHQWLASDGRERIDAGEVTAPRAVALHCDFDALPFPNQSLDLVLLPHTLELSHDPHQTLREVERVLVPEGRVVVLGFNPSSPWGLRQRLGRLRLRLGGRRPLFLPNNGEFIGARRLRDWLRLLSFEVEAGHFGCCRPPLRSQRWLERFAWMESAGDRWGALLGAAYVVVAVKRVRGMRLVGLVKERKKPHAAPAVVANRHKETLIE